GTCTNGSCSYNYANGASCDDGNGCTTADHCQNGVCSGAPITCTSPPAAACVNATTLRTYGSPGTCSAGTCSYPSTDTTCPGGCMAATCNVPLDAWTGATSTTGAPSARSNHTAVWTGSEMIVWGGGAATSDFNTGGRYAPATNTWTALPTAGAPSPRWLHTAV